VLGDFFERALGNLERFECSFQVLTWMGLKKLASLPPQSFDDLPPLFSFTVCSWVGLVLNFATEASLLESFFHGVAFAGVCSLG